MVVDVLVEGVLDATVAERVLSHCGLVCGYVFGRKGVGYIKENARRFNNAIDDRPLLVLVDFMDTKMRCPAAVMPEWIDHPSPRLVFRCVVREVESWLMADSDGLAEFLGISPKHLRTDPETIADPKRRLLEIAANSKSKKLTELYVST
jgi:hypothetical protein